jgi:hypothetical protein
MYLVRARRAEGEVAGSPGEITADGDEGELFLLALGDRVGGSRAASFKSGGDTV